MKNIFFLIVSICLFSCQNSKTQSSNFKVTYNQNTETYFLAELLAVEYRKTNVQWENYKLKTCREYQPIVQFALKSFKSEKNEAFAKETAKFCDTLVSYGYGNDIMMSILLQEPEFNKNQKLQPFELSNLNLNDQQKQDLKNAVSNYLVKLYQFYIDQNVGGFYRAHKSFYIGAINEVENLIPVNFTNAMETYYGEKRHQYVALVSPMQVWPIEEHEGRGIGATVETDEGKTVNEIMSPYVQIPINETNAYNSFGFNYEPTATFLTVHEFSHSFVNPSLEEYKNRIELSSNLFTANLREKMASKGVASWQTYVIESLVRLGEIRIAAIQKDYEREKRLRIYHTETEHFIYLPKLEKAIIEFENNRDKYPMWKDFIPNLLDVFEKSDTTFVNSKLKQ